MAVRLSGVQKQVLALYRRALRMTRTKPPATRTKFLTYVTYTFHRNAKLVSPREFSTIEYMIRQGTKQLEMYENPALRDCFLNEEMAEWVKLEANRKRVAALNGWKGAESELLATGTTN
ncbi:hypothetical protein DL93DRAFT_2089305 [Clavulina sp. PMI_390]|nr:hypothetical protein DL93DRAFT_2089305 [Clavulina sp. PMI_390]